MDELITRIHQPLLKRIIALLPRGEPVFLVGGAIRDALLNRPSYDLDFVLSGDAIKIARQVANDLGAAFFPLDSNRNFARLIIKSPGQLDGRGSSSMRIDFSTFQGEDLTSDLQRRDFTMNAIAVDIHQLHTMIDPLGGAADLVARLLKPCLPTSFLDDPVRILRAVRFSVDLNLHIQPETHRLMREAADHLPEVSAERLRDELFRILLQSHPSTSLRMLDILDVLKYFLPEVCLLKGVQQSSPHIMDAWEHTLNLLVRLEDLLEVMALEYNQDKARNLTMGLVSLRLGRFRQQMTVHLSNALNPDRPHRGIIFLAGLYHDVGKRKTQTVDESGKIRFIEHEHIGGRLAEKRGQALKLSNHEIERMVTIVSHHMRPSMISHLDEIPNKRVIYRFFRDTGAAGVDICILSLADVLATYGATLLQERWIRHVNVVRVLLSAWWEEPDQNIFPQPLINGDTLMSELNLAPGSIVGYLLESIREAQVAGEIHTPEEASNLARSILLGKDK